MFNHFLVFGLGSTSRAERYLSFMYSVTIMCSIPLAAEALIAACQKSTNARSVLIIRR